MLALPFEALMTFVTFRGESENFPGEFLRITGRGGDSGLLVAQVIRDLAANDAVQFGEHVVVQIAAKDFLIG